MCGVRSFGISLGPEISSHQPQAYVQYSQCNHKPDVRPKLICMRVCVIECARMCAQATKYLVMRCCPWVCTACDANNRGSGRLNSCIFCLNVHIPSRSWYCWFLLKMPASINHPTPTLWETPPYVPHSLNSFDCVTPTSHRTESVRSQRHHLFHSTDKPKGNYRSHDESVMCERTVCAMCFACRVVVRWD